MPKMPTVDFYDIDSVDASLFKIAIIAARHKGKWVYCRHARRHRWEFPAGHREAGETIVETANRELMEETGAIKYELTPIIAYSVGDKKLGYGLLSFAEVEEFGPIPDDEVEYIEFFDDVPDEMKSYEYLEIFRSKVRAFLGE